MIPQLKRLVVLLVLLLSGCAQQPHKVFTPLISQNWPQHQAQVQAINIWKATGKLAVKTPDDGGSVTLRWQQQNAEYYIDLNGPFGQGNISIEGAPGHVTFSGGDKPSQSAKTAEELLLKNTGWNIPLTQLAYWVRGLPDPSTKLSHFTPNAQGLIGELEQAGWKISYGDYINTQSSSEVIAMPSRITAEYNKEIRLTLLIRAWQLGDAP